MEGRVSSDPPPIQNGLGVFFATTPSIFFRFAPEQVSPLPLPLIHRCNLLESLDRRYPGWSSVPRVMFRNVPRLGHWHYTLVLIKELTPTTILQSQRVTTSVRQQFWGQCQAA